MNIREFSQEFRVDFSRESTKWLIGAFYSKKLNYDYFNRQNIYKTNINRYWNLSNPDEDKALFFNSEYWLNDNVALSGGVRFQRIERDFAREYQDFNPTNHIYFNKKVSENHILPKLSISYYDENDAIYYFTYSKGYRPGGYSYRSTEENQNPFQPEITNSLEMGYKNRFNNIEISNAFFYNLVDDLRINTFRDDLSVDTLNVAKASIYGLESDITYTNDNILLYTTFGFVKGKFDKFKAKREFQGNTIIDVPNITASIGTQIDLSNNFLFKSSIRYVGKRYYDISNENVESGYKVVNSSISYNRSGFVAEIYANNLFDERYVDFMVATLTNNYYHFGTPRVVGFKLSKSF